MKQFWKGFAVCYLLGVLATGISANRYVNLTGFGVAYTAVLWLPLNLLPSKIVEPLTPKAVFDESWSAEVE